MTVTTTRKYNPGFLTDDELVASFCVRTHEFESIVEMLRECTGNPNKHQIVIGPRGSGKTSLLLRVAAEVRRDADMAARFFPIVFAEESYEVGTAGEFWLECLARLADQAPEREGAPDLHRTLDDMRAIRDDQSLGERCLATVLDFADREDKRLVLMVENLNMMFRDMTDRDTGWRLRKVLQTEPRIILLASATSRFDEIDQQDHALYEQLREITLHRLTTEECAILWETVSGQKRPQGTIRSLEILTGGSPRLLAIVARFGAGLSFRALMDNLLDLVDDHTEYFKSHLESLPPQERRVYLAVADLWKPALTKEVADRARIETSICSAQLKRLVERGAVLVAGGSARRKQYYLSERMYNIYYLVRRNGGQDCLVEALLRCMADLYTPEELTGIGTLWAQEIEKNPTDILLQYAHKELMALPALAGEPQEMSITSVPATEDTRAARELLKKGFTLWQRNRTAEALDAFNELQYRFGKGDTPEPELEPVARALFNKGVTLQELDRPEEALATYDEVLQRFGHGGTLALLQVLARALVNKGVILGNLGLPEEAIAVYGEVFRRFGDSGKPVLLASAAMALVNKGITLASLNRLEDALAVHGQVLRSFSSSDSPVLLVQVARALVSKGVTLGALNRLEQELAVYNEVLHRFLDSDESEILENVATALIKMGITLGKLNRLEEALAAYDEAIRLFGESDEPPLLERAALANINKLRVVAVLKLPVQSRDVGTLLRMLPKLDDLPAGTHKTLMTLSIEIGLDWMLRLIQDSPAADSLPSLTTALEREVGLSPRVPQEVSEMAEDIRKELAEMREARST